MIQYPLVFKVKSSARAGISSNWETSSTSVATAVAMSIPPEFEGPGGGFSPEDIYTGKPKIQGPHPHLLNHFTCLPPPEKNLIPTRPDCRW
jgi:hypothetical protein